MFSRSITIFLFLFISLSLYAEDGIIKGRVLDSKTKEAIIGASAVADSSGGVTTDLNGNYELKLSAGSHKIVFSYLGYKIQKVSITILANEVQVKDVLMEEDVKELGTIVISAGKFEQKLEEVTVSMDVIKPQLIENKNTTNLQTVIDQIPGVNVMDGQVQMRGGSGFSYGAGSRVMLLVDDLPMLTADAGDIKWNYLPVENLEQVEVIKGASSSLFGSSALNGVINVRTAYPKDKPITSINVSYGGYMNPQRDTLRWWGNSNPTIFNTCFFHSRKIKNFDLVIGGNIYNDQGYRKLETEFRYRFNFNTRYRFKKVPGLSVGVNGNRMVVSGGLFILWKSADSAYYPQGDSLQIYTNYRTTIDPYLTYYQKNGCRHTLRTRFFRSYNTNDKAQGAKADMYYAEYQYQKHFKNDFTLTAGTAYTYSEIHSDSLYGQHFSNNLAIFTQLDKKIKRLTLSFGARGEYFKVDTSQTKYYFGKNNSSIPIYPVFRFGANYHVAEYTWLRGSFGQGYRFPAVAEKYIATNVNGLKIYPNPNLRPENGWSAEIGAKQAFKFGSWVGFLDVALFWTEYQNMMEFNFAPQVPASIPNPSPIELATYFGAQSINVGHTRITGIEPSVNCKGNIGKVEVIIMGGYTYIDPINLNKDAAYNRTGTDTISGILKYRSKHTAKGDIEFTYKKFAFGTSVRYNSFMKNIDRRFEDPLLYDIFPTLQLYILPGLKQYRADHNKGDVIIDARFSYKINKLAKASLICNNVLNREYMNRPGNVMPPRNIGVQVVVKF